MFQMCLKLSEVIFDDIRALSVIGECSSAIGPESATSLREIVRVWYNGKSVPHDELDEDTLVVAIHTGRKRVTKLFKSLLGGNEWILGHGKSLLSWQ